MAEKDVAGWVNVPANCVRQLERIHLHAARPAGVNEPTADGLAGAEEILRLVQTLGPDDLCLCLISGGGSALLPAPVQGVSLADKVAVTRHLSAAGANIRQLNTVRKQLSRIKGGGLARACRAGRLISLIISDVLGDPLDLIASGPTVEDTSTPDDALTVLAQFRVHDVGIAPTVVDYLTCQPRNATPPPTCRVTNLVIGNNATAVQAACVEAQRLGYRAAMHAATALEGEANDVGRQLAEMAIRMRKRAQPDCQITGGEPVVTLVDASRRGTGGRNQQVVLAAFDRLWQQHRADEVRRDGLLRDGLLRDILVLSGGTDGEDGPTDAAGALADDVVATAAESQGLDPGDYLARNDAYSFFQRTGGLIRTGPTHTNVCDLRVVLVRRDAEPVEVGG
jgi:hydroxypyruvate reductase